MQKGGSRKGARGWLTKDATGLVAVSVAHTQTITEIFRRCLDGETNADISEALNRGSVPLLSRSRDKWNEARVNAVLADGLVVQHGLVTQSQFDRAGRVSAGNRGRPPARKRGAGKDVRPNLLSGRYYCGHCREKLVQRGEYGNDYLACAGDCELSNVPCSAAELSILAWMEFIQGVGISEQHGTLELIPGAHRSAFLLPDLDQLNAAYFGGSTHDAGGKLEAIRRQISTNLASLIDKVEFFEQTRDGVAVHLRAWAADQQWNGGWISRRMRISGPGIDQQRNEDTNMPWAHWYTGDGLMLEWTSFADQQ